MIADVSQAESHRMKQPEFNSSAHLHPEINTYVAVCELLQIKRTQRRESSRLRKMEMHNLGRIESRSTVAQVANLLQSFIETTSQTFDYTTVLSDVMQLLEEGIESGCSASLSKLEHPRCL